MKLIFMGIFDKKTGDQIILGTEGKVIEVSENKNGVLFSKNDYGIELPLNENRNTTKNSKGILIESEDYNSIYQYK